MTLTNSTSLTTRAHDGAVNDDTDPAARPTRRTFTADQKVAILAAYEEATEPGAKGALLRREGIYSSQITEWRKLRDAGVLAGKKPGEKEDRGVRQHLADRDRDVSGARR